MVSITVLIVFHAVERMVCITVITVVKVFCIAVHIVVKKADIAFQTVSAVVLIPFVMPLKNPLIPFHILLKNSLTPFHRSSHDMPNQLRKTSKIPLNTFSIFLILLTRKFHAAINMPFTPSQTCSQFPVKMPINISRTAVMAQVQGMSRRYPILP